MKGTKRGNHVHMHKGMQGNEQTQVRKIERQARKCTQAVKDRQAMREAKTGRQAGKGTK